MFEVNPKGGPAIIEIEIGIEIGKLPGLDFDHDFDTDSELPRFKNKLALDLMTWNVDLGAKICFQTGARVPAVSGSAAWKFFSRTGAAD